ncbi:MAG: 50S ribosomal protein L13 [Acidobacteriota bacterium]|nr:50S ribosomal protein L13 [Acidobacteriota bacterium]
MSTFFPRKEDITRKWYVLDAAGLPLGRVATFAANLLTGKRNPKYTPHMDMGDHVIIVNADKAVLTGKKMKFKAYRRHSSRPGGLKEVAAEHMFAKHPTRPIELAVKGMLPKTKLGRAMYRKLNVYAGSDHPHAAQKPEKLEVAL